MTHDGILANLGRSIAVSRYTKGKMPEKRKYFSSSLAFALFLFFFQSNRTRAGAIIGRGAVAG